MWSREDKDGDTVLVATHDDDSIATVSDTDKTDSFVCEMLGGKHLDTNDCLELVP
jgi:hypothetical protein